MDTEVLNWAWVVCSVFLLTLNLWTWRLLRKTEAIADDALDMAEEAVERETKILKLMHAVAEGKFKVYTVNGELRFDQITKRGASNV